MRFINKFPLKFTRKLNFTVKAKRSYNKIIYYLQELDPNTKVYW